MDNEYVLCKLQPEYIIFNNVVLLFMYLCILHVETADDMGLGKTLTMIALVMASVAQKETEDSDEEDDWKSSARHQRT